MTVLSPMGQSTYSILTHNSWCCLTPALKSNLPPYHPAVADPITARRAQLLHNGSLSWLWALSWDKQWQEESKGWHIPCPSAFLLLLFVWGNCWVVVSCCWGASISFLAVANWLWQEGGGLIPIARVRKLLPIWDTILPVLCPIGDRSVKIYIMTVIFY